MNVFERFIYKKLDLSVFFSDNFFVFFEVFFEVILDDLLVEGLKLR